MKIVLAEKAFEIFINKILVYIIIMKIWVFQLENAKFAQKLIINGVMENGRYIRTCWRWLDSDLEIVAVFRSIFFYQYPITNQSCCQLRFVVSLSSPAVSFSIFFAARVNMFSAVNFFLLSTCPKRCVTLVLSLLHTFYSLLPALSKQSCHIFFPHFLIIFFIINQHLPVLFSCFLCCYWC